MGIEPPLPRFVSLAFAPGSCPPSLFLLLLLYVTSRLRYSRPVRAAPSVLLFPRAPLSHFAPLSLSLLSIPFLSSSTCSILANLYFLSLFPLLPLFSPHYFSRSTLLTPSSSGRPLLCPILCRAFVDSRDCVMHMQLHLASEYANPITAVKLDCRRLSTVDRPNKTRVFFFFLFASCRAPFDFDLLSFSKKASLSDACHQC